MPEVRLVGDNVETGIYSYEEAMRIAESQGLDLVEITAKADPPVCRVIDYQKFLYQQKKREKERKANAAKIVVKEIRFGPQTDDHDFNFKLNHAKEFLKEGYKVKAYVFFKGRSILSKIRAKRCWHGSLRSWKNWASPNNFPDRGKAHDHYNCS